MYVPTTLKIIVLKGNANKQGLIPILLKFTQNRQTNRIALRKYIKPKDWLDDGKFYVRERGANAPTTARALNLFLKSQLARAESIMLEAERMDQPLTFPQFKRKFINTESQDFLEFCEQELEKRKLSGKYSIETIKSNWFKLNKLKAFRPKVSFFDLNVPFLEDYEVYMRVTRGNDVNTIFAAMKFIRTMLNVARKQKLTNIYPFDQYKLVYKKDTRERLSSHELDSLQKLYNEGTLPEHMQQVLRYFLFACYTGLTWGDLVNFNYKEIEHRRMVFLINKKRQKTGNRFVVPLLNQAKKLIDLTQSEGKVFPEILTNQKANSTIKQVISLTKISKRISFHCARHSFGTIALNNGISRESIQRMLGHSKEEMTKLYSKLQDETIIEEMQKWENDVPTSEYKKKLSEEALGIYKKLRTQLVAARIAGGFAEIDIAAKVGINEQNYKKMERGELQFGMAHLLDLGRYLDLDLKGLFNQVL